MKKQETNWSEGNLPIRLSEIARKGIVSRTTLWRWKERGLKTFKVGGITFVFPSDLDAFIRDESRKAESGPNSK